MTCDSKVAEWLDKQELHENLMTYCRGVDRMDLDLMKSTYWPDGTDDHGRFRGNAYDWCVEALKAREKLISCNHHVSNVLIELTGGTAKRESMFLVVTTYGAHGSAMFLGGRYRDFCERREGRWKVLHRVCVWDWNREIEARPGWRLMDAPEVSNWGRFHPFDPIYLDWRVSEPATAVESGRAEVSAWRRGNI